MSSLQLMPLPYYAPELPFIMRLETPEFVPVMWSPCRELAVWVTWPFSMPLKWECEPSQFLTMTIKDLAEKLGAHHFINTGNSDGAKELQKLGGAKLILATAPHSDAISSVVDGLGIDGKLLMVAATGEPIEVSPMQLLMGRKSAAGWPSGTAMDSEDTLNFSAMTGTTPMIEEYSLDDVNEAFDKMMNNKARFRVVLKP